MSENKKVQFIPARPQRDMIPVGIYCRVSTAAKEQLNSTFAQGSDLTRQVALFDEWKLADTYVEVELSVKDRYIKALSKKKYKAQF